jgi:hypothetical protein
VQLLCGACWCHCAGIAKRPHPLCWRSGRFGVVLLADEEAKSEGEDGEGDEDTEHAPGVNSLLGGAALAVECVAEDDEGDVEEDEAGEDENGGHGVSP